MCYYYFENLIPLSLITCKQNHRYSTFYCAHALAHNTPTVCVFVTLRCVTPALRWPEWQHTRQALPVETFINCRCTRAIKLHDNPHICVKWQRSPAVGTANNTITLCSDADTALRPAQMLGSYMVNSRGNNCLMKVCGCYANLA